MLIMTPLPQKMQKTHKVTILPHFVGIPTPKKNGDPNLMTPLPMAVCWQKLGVSGFGFLGKKSMRGETHSSNL